MKTDPNKDFTIKEIYIKVKGDYGKEKNVRVCANGGGLWRWWNQRLLK